MQPKLSALLLCLSLLLLLTLPIRLLRPSPPTPKQGADPLPLEGTAS